MKFYDCATAPSPRRVRVFLAEKGIAVPTVQVDLRSGEHFGDAFRAVNAELTVPVLELDDGRRLIEAEAICRYFEELQPSPPLFGRDAADKAFVAEWQRRAERDGFYAVMEGFRNQAKAFKNRAIPGPIDYEQIPALADRGRARVGHFFETLDRRLAEHQFLAGAHYSIADITAMISVDFAKWLKLAIPDDAANLRRWHAAVSARPSAAA